MGLKALATAMSASRYSIWFMPETMVAQGRVKAYRKAGSGERYRYPSPTGFMPTTATPFSAARGSSSLSLEE